MSTVNGDKIRIELKDGMEYKGYILAEFPDQSEIPMKSEMTGMNKLYFNKNMIDNNVTITFHLFYQTTALGKLHFILSDMSLVLFVLFFAETII